MLAGALHPVRADLAEACVAGWARIGRPGQSWTGPERVAIAGEARAATSCGLCAQRKAAVSPYAVEGTHPASSPLAPVAVDAVHRIVTDPGRLTERWLGEVFDGGVDEAQFVELVGVVATVVAIDTLGRAIGAEPSPLPEPQPGAPSRVLPAGLAAHSAWVPTVVPDQADGAVATYYRDRVTNPWGFIGNVHRALTMAPDEQLSLCSLMEAMYIPVRRMGGADSPRVISIPQIEFLAATVSVANECFY